MSGSRALATIRLRLIELVFCCRIALLLQRDASQSQVGRRYTGVDAHFLCTGERFFVESDRFFIPSQRSSAIAAQMHVSDDALPIVQLAAYLQDFAELLIRTRIVAAGEGDPRQCTHRI